jgi:hypothetical protein
METLFVALLADGVFFLASGFGSVLMLGHP